MKEKEKEKEPEEDPNRNEDEHPLRIGKQGLSLPLLNTTTALSSDLKPPVIVHISAPFLA